ncbi:hypothetical protein Tco_1385128 [Tanacetum coccineum]
MCGVCIGILACRGLSLVSSPLHAMKPQSQIQSSAVVKFGVKRAGLLQSSWIAGKWLKMGSIEVTWFGGRISLILSRVERSIMSVEWQVSSSDGGNLIDFSKSKGIVKPPGSFSLGGTFFRTIAEHCSFNGLYKGDIDVNLLDVKLLDVKLLDVKLLDVP